MFTDPEANNCFSIIFRGAYQELQNDGLKHKSTAAINCSCACTYAAVVLMISLNVYRLQINLLIEFDSTNGRNTMIIKFIRYLRFIVVVFIHSSHHRFKMSSFSLKKTKFRSVVMTCCRSTQPLRLRFLKALNTSS